jgi:hypothetical protein
MKRWFEIDGPFSENDCSALQGFARDKVVLERRL